MSVAPGYEAAVDIPVFSVTVLRQTGLPGFLEAWMTPGEQQGQMLEYLATIDVR